MRKLALVALTLVLFVFRPAAQGAGAVIVPDRFLRGYDPVTVRFDRDVGPRDGGPLDGPSSFLSIDPRVDGEYLWLDSRTVRFMPSAHWPALKTFRIEAAGSRFELTTMIAPPVGVSPEPGATGMEPFSSISLAFPSALGADSLRKMLSIELRDLPGIASAGAEWLPEGAFSVAELESGKSASRIVYRITLDRPVPYGKRAILRVRLSPDPALADSLMEFSWETKPDFRLVGMGGGSSRLPVPPSGASYAADQALSLGTDAAAIFLEFSEALSPPRLEAVKRSVVFDPSVRELSFETSDKRLVLRFEADRERLYRVSVDPAAFVSATGRPSAGRAPSSFYVYMKKKESFLTWKDSEGILERFGPRQFPMEGRAAGRADLRIHRIDPLSYDFQPFPKSPIAIDEAARPPMPGEEPAPGTDIAAQIRLLGSPPFSRIVDLPIGALSARSSFGLDVGPYLDSAFDDRRAGTYLLGLRSIDASSTRYWVKAVVTDLCLTAVEEERAIQFYVTSISTGEPVPGALVRLEAGRKGSGPERVLAEGSTDRYGAFRLEHRSAMADVPDRVVVAKDEDVLVLRPSEGLPAFARNHWSSDRSWLAWLADPPAVQREKPRKKGWITTERPVYRPDEPVHVVGWAREWRQGRIEKYRDADLEATVSGPGDTSWKYDVKLGAWGSFAFDFTEKDLPTGDYAVSLAQREGPVLSTAPFRVLAYRVPLFEVSISGPDMVSLDSPFELLLTADYYSGGRMTGESVTWEIEQYPWGVKAADYPGFAFSTDERFGSGSRWGTVETGLRDSVLDQEGASRLSLDPRKERDGRARRYVVTGTVRGADRQTVVASRNVYALPPFSLGVKADRVVKGGSRIEGDFLVLDYKEKPEPGRTVQVRLIQRQWHSYVSETDFTTGEAKYVSESVDVPLEERSFVSGTGPVRLGFDVKESGVYLLEASARDHLGRRIVVSTDLFLSGEGPVAWERKAAGTFEITGDKPSYKPGETAVLVLKSPYNEGFALVVVEAPEALAYSVVRVKDGRGIFELPVRADMAPGISVQSLLYRGRAGSPDVDLARRADLGKPSSVGASYALKVLPVANQVSVALDHPAKGRPGTAISVKISAKDEAGRPLDGEAVLWLVDKAVLSLGSERELDPLGAFLDRIGSSVRIADSRNLGFGYLPVSEIPGGDGAEDLYMMGELFNRSTVRKNFKTVPYFKAGIPVKGGSAVVEVALPDNLTDFAVRAVVTSGFDRFGAARSVLPVRLALTLQSILPRFARPYDEFTAGATLRVVEGSGGDAAWGYRLKGIVAEGEEGPRAARPVTLPDKDAVSLELPLSVPFNLAPGPEAALIGFAAERLSDGAKDSFEVELPIRPDAQRRTEFASVTLDGKAAIALPAVSAVARSGTLNRNLLVARDPRLLAIGRGYAYLRDYPHGCLEQRTSQLFPSVAMRDFTTSLGLAPAASGGAGLKAVVRDYERYAASCQADSGLLSYWPKSQPSVGLTAYAVEFLVACREAGLAGDAVLLERAQEGLRRALRSDFPVWEARWADFERVQAFGALEAAGAWEASYAGYFLDRADALDLVSKARLMTLLRKRGMAGGAKAAALEKSLAASLVTKKERGKDVLAGLKDFQASGRVLLTETRAVAAVLEALAPQDKAGQRTALLADWLISRAGNQGWGSTMETVSALRALSAWLGSEKADEIQVEARSGSRVERLSTKGARLASFDLAGFDSGQLALVKGADKGAVTLLVTTSYVPAPRGGTLKAYNAGFAVEREFLPVLADGSLGKALPAPAGGLVEFGLDDVVEEHATLVNFEDRSFVAFEIPVAAGMELLDPRLAGVGPEASPLGALTLEPSYSMQLDDKVAYYYDSLPKGTYHFFFRTKASFVGEYTAPQAKAELMYDQTVTGLSAGTNLAVRAR